MKQHDSFGTSCLDPIVRYKLVQIDCSGYSVLFLGLLQSMTAEEVYCLVLLA